jgi:hypothetical protein
MVKIIGLDKFIQSIEKHENRTGSAAESVKVSVDAIME